MKIVIAYPPDLDSDLIGEIAAPDDVEIVHAPYGESYDRRTARRRGERPETAADRAVVRTSSFARAVADADALFALDLPTELNQLAPRLQWIHAVGAGTDHLNTVDLPDGVVLTNSSGVAADAIAEFVIARLFFMWKRFDELGIEQRAHRWTPQSSTMLLGKTLCIVGFGAIGQAVAVRARALGMRVIGVRRRPAPHPTADLVVPPDRLTEVLARSDAVAVCASLNDTSHQLVDASAFWAMKQGSILCNISRGLTIDQDALVQSLVSGRLAAASIDVMREEPLPSSHPLWDVPHLYISPHCSGATDVGHTAAALRLFGENLRRWLVREDLLNVVPR